MAGKRVLVTGAAQGIGLGIARRFLAEGARVVLLDRDEAGLAEALRSLQLLREDSAADANALTEVCDLGDPAALEAAAERAMTRLGGLDVLVNNAGIAYREAFLDIPLAQWEAVFDVNVRAAFRLGQLAARRMIADGHGGAIVNMSSKNGLSGSGELAAYNASKAALILLGESMAVELAPHGIRVNAVAPGFVDTPLDRRLREQQGLPPVSARTPMGRAATIDEVAAACLYLASDEASFVTGATLRVDGGHLAAASEL
ncbi:SDR family oxidoreductase [Paenibacillus sp. IB182496]|uniref:SDR family oxidoreductase n=2 Tax=Paenibacillus sabuli TaxID=2772509 RepID=A0A927GQF0_9BACL|nr:SDR family oxidoreductase [Paenibacillus sabuli]